MLIADTGGEQRVEERLLVLQVVGRRDVERAEDLARRRGVLIRAITVGDPGGEVRMGGPTAGPAWSGRQGVPSTSFVPPNP